MSPLFVKDNKLLIENNKLKGCCCNACATCPNDIDFTNDAANTKITFYFTVGNCERCLNQTVDNQLHRFGEQACEYAATYDMTGCDGLDNVIVTVLFLLDNNCDNTCSNNGCGYLLNGWLPDYGPNPSPPLTLVFPYVVIGGECPV